MELEKKTVRVMGTLMTTEGVLSSVQEVEKESSPGCATSSSGTNAEPKGFKRYTHLSQCKCTVHLCSMAKWYNGRILLVWHLTGWTYGFESSLRKFWALCRINP